MTHLNATVAMASEGNLQPTQAPAITLYGCWRSSCSHRLQLALRLKQLPFQYRPVSLDRQEQRQPWFVTLNPLAQLPVLQVDDEIWADSLVALETLEHRFAGQGLALLPDQPSQLLQVRRVVSAIGSGLQPLLMPGQFRAHLNLGEDALQRVRHDHQCAGLERLQQLMRPMAGTYSVGDAPTMADVVLVAHLEAVARLGVDLGRFDLLSRIASACLQQQPFAAARPALMVDAPAEGNAPAMERILQDKEAPLAGPSPLAAALSHRFNKPIPGFDAVRRQSIEHFGAVASKVTTLDVCLLLRWLAASRRCTRALEIGVFTGSSSLALLDGLGPTGTLTAIDNDPHSTAIAQQSWQQLGQASRVRFLLGDALHLMPDLEPGFDLIYIDGANWEYEAYLDAALPLLAADGVLVFDNVLWRGLVLDPEPTDRSAAALAQFNARLLARNDLTSAILRLGDGVALVMPLRDQPGR
jgi:maleylacetoacetate isomerase